MPTYLLDTKTNTIITDAIELIPGIWVHKEGNRHICTDAQIGDKLSGRRFCILDTESDKRILIRIKQDVNRQKQEKEESLHKLEEARIRQRKEAITQAEMLVKKQKEFREKDLIPLVDKNYSAVDSLPRWIADYITANGVLGRLGNGDNSGQDETEDQDKIKKYLGTYFPRTYSEALCIYLNILNFSQYAKLIADRETFRILDVGCGNGGQTIALCSTLIHKIPKLKKIEIISYDAEEGFVKDYSELLKKLAELSGITISLDFRKKLFASQDNGEDIISFRSLLSCFKDGKQFDFIHSFKMLCELVGPSSKANFLDPKIREENDKQKIFEACSNVYKSFVSSLLPLLGENGIFVVCDISRKKSMDSEADEEKNYWYANFLSHGTLQALMDLKKDFRILIPAICTLQRWDKNCFNCFSQRQYSFPQQYQYDGLSAHTEKISFRVVSRTATVNNLLVNYDTTKSFIKNKRQTPDPDKLCHDEQSNNSNNTVDAFIL